MADPQEKAESKGRVLLVDDDAQVLRAYARVLDVAGYTVRTASGGRAAADVLETESFDVIVSDIRMPDMDGMELLRRIREHDLDVPVVIMTGAPAVETAAEAIQYGAFRYLLKPVPPKQLDQILESAVRMHRMARLRREVLVEMGGLVNVPGDLAGLESVFERAIDGMWMAYQPIVSWSKRSIYAYEALVRTTEPAVPHPGALLHAAERLGRLPSVGRAVRAQVAAALERSPALGQLFTNLHPSDLLDDALYARDAPLSSFATRVVLEITERATLEEMTDVRARVATLREMGFRIAVDDLGAGYAGLASFAQLEPEVVKFDMCLVRNIQQEPTKRKLLGSMTALCREMGIAVIAEGIETPQERDALAEIGCDLLQGYLFARPGPEFPEVSW